MKKINLIVIGIIGLMLLPLGVKASDNVTLSLSCDELILNQVKACKLYADVASSHTIGGVDLELELTNLTIDSFTKNAEFGLDEVDETFNNIVLISTSDLSGRVLLGEFKLKAISKEGVKFAVKNAEYSIEEEATETEPEPVEFTFTVKEATTTGSTPGDSGSSEEDKDDADCSLSSLSVENETLDPKFKSSVYEYELKTNAKTITIKATANSSKAKISGIGKINVEDGKTYNIVVTAENGNKATYKIKVTKDVTDTSNKQNTKNEKSKEGNPDTGIISISIISVIVIVLCFIIFSNRHKLNLFKKF